MVNLNRQIRATQARRGGFSSHVLPGVVVYEAGTLQWVFKPSKWGWDVLKLGTSVVVQTVPTSDGLYYTKRDGGTTERVSALPPNDPPMVYAVTGERLDITVPLLGGQGNTEMLSFTDPDLSTVGKRVAGVTTEMLIRFPTTSGATLGSTGLTGQFRVDNGEPPAADANVFDAGGQLITMQLTNNSSLSPYRLIGGGLVGSTGNPTVSPGINVVMDNNDGQTHHVAMVLDSRAGQDQLRYYFDGNIVTTTAVLTPGLAGALEFKRILLLLTLAQVVVQDVRIEQVRFTHAPLYTTNFTPPQL